MDRKVMRVQDGVFVRYAVATVTCDWCQDHQSKEVCIRNRYSYKMYGVASFLHEDCARELGVEW
jgi:hypothetical protein